MKPAKQEILSVKQLQNPLKAFEVCGKNDLKIQDLPEQAVNPELQPWKTKLAEAKLPLDKCWNNAFERYWREFDPFRAERDIVVKLSNDYNISNAWLKCYELICYFNLVPKSGQFYHFDNAAFPGSFIISSYHYIKTNTNIQDYKWYASSLAEKNIQDAAPLEDKYKLFANYRANWLMSASNNGDVLIEANQEDFVHKIGNQIDLYTSDLGFDVSSDYNNQELLQARANIGQILSGLLTLKQGGCLVTKQYTFFEPISLSVIYATSSFFEQFYIVKPYTSREANSEIYLVGKGFKADLFGKTRFDHPYIRAMLDRATGLVDIKKPFLTPDEQFMKQILKATESITQSQINKLKHNMEACQHILGSNYRGPPALHPTILEFRESVRQNIYAWYYYNNIKPIERSERLNMADALGQLSRA